ncbi:hypothetical protein CAPTEDRAFT_221756 [Capitella teleta]|uniref:Tetraspanin n=1 Tax=Capitella teleta TaxID=283909 RepID=R7UAL5_CAPTE|nr:hypothetical protein CAPTEDRAFT_221756 [Capitella teleta]|eukprot:ELU00853.1 hypothetical protein CAPTEDRAFT_221756 [Capitella teleta]
MAGLSCGAKMLKFIMFVMNFLFWVIGGAMLGIGIWLAVDDDIGFLEDLIEDNPMDDPLWSAAVYTIIAIGAFVFLLGFLGCCGACTQNSCMLCAYQIIVSIVLVAEVVCVILMIVFKSDIGDGFEESMLDTVINKYEQPTQGSATAAQDEMQRDMKCCGAKEPEDYQKSAWYNITVNQQYKVPRSCCKGVEDTGNDNDYSDCNDEVGTSTSNILFNRGCTQQVKNWIDDNSIIFIAVVCSFIGLQILGLIFACCLKSSFDDLDGTV